MRQRFYIEYIKGSDSRILLLDENFTIDMILRLRYCMFDVVYEDDAMLIRRSDDKLAEDNDNQIVVKKDTVIDRQLLTDILNDLDSIFFDIKRALDAMNTAESSINYATSLVRCSFE